MRAWALALATRAREGGDPPFGSLLVGSNGAVLKEETNSTLTDVDITALVDFHESHDALATVTAVRPMARFGALKITGETVDRFVEKPSGEGGRINGGFFVLSSKVLDMIDGDETVFEQGPLEQLAAAKQLRAFRHEGFWQPMDTLRDKLLLEDLWARGAPWKSW